MDIFDALLKVQEQSLRDWRREILAQETQDATLLAALESHLDWLSQKTRARTRRPPGSRA
jgi:hypothetical protein